jgi:3-hydroxyisobutyrate dehydrogenase-like beta-hydroxyacid dehydrogenase
MEKDFATGVAMAQDLSVPVPFMAAALRVWRDITAEIGPDADFTRVHAVVAARSSRKPDRGEQLSIDIEVLERALAAVNLVATREMLRVLDAEGLDRERALAIINASTGRSEATRAGGAGEIDREALRLAAELADRAGAWTPLTALAAGGVG